MKFVTSSIQADGIAVLRFSNPPVNALSSALQAELSKELKSICGSPNARAIVLYGEKSPGFFSSGADISEFKHISATNNLFESGPSWCYTGCEESLVPVVAAIDGVCFGGGLELVLCCAARVATETSSFSLPELKLGIIPGLGGTQRLPRVVGFQLASEMILTSKPISATKALEAGLVDVVVESNVLEAAIAYANKLVLSEKPLVKTIERNDKLEGLPICEKIYEQLRQTLVPKLSKGEQLPQYAAALDVSFFGAKHGGKKGLEEEKRVFLRLVTSPHSLGLIHTFFATRKTTKVSAKDGEASERLGTPPRKVAIIGGGLMGAGIATACIMVGIPVIIKELNEKFATAAKARVGKNLGTSQQNKMTLLTVTTDYSALSDVDIAIEAVLENPILKQKIFAELEAVCRSDCILATNTSTINIDLIGLGSPKARAQGRVIGAHFFSPAQKMPLLEVVRTESTSSKVIEDVMAFGKKIKKTCVLVGNCAGFAVNRMYFPQGMVASFITTVLGVDPYRVDMACETFGLPMGPFRLSDLVGLDIAVAVNGVFEMAFAERSIQSSPVTTALLGAGRKGQKSGEGFYKYGHKSRAGEVDRDGINPYLEKARESVDKEYSNRVRQNFGEISEEDIVNMLLLSCVNEGYRILDEGIAQSPSDLDVCSIMGMAFPPHRGGLMYWAQTAFGGAVGMLSELKSYHERSEGFPLFKPSFALVRAARNNKPIGTIVRPSLSGGGANDIVVVSGYRTAVGRAGRGGLKDTLPDDMLIPLLRQILEDTRVNPKDVGDVITGTVLQRGDTSVVQLRVAGLLSGLPETVPVKVVNRLCSSGLQAIADGAAAIEAGHQKIVIAGGIETMSMASMENKEIQGNDKVRQHKEAIGCYMSMGQTSENVAEKYGISKERQDRLAVVSHARASVAKLSGRQRGEIVPIRTKVKVIDKETKRELGLRDVVIDEDEGVRVGVTMERLAKLPTVFKRGGTTTPGNSSQLSDGAALLMLMKRSEANARGVEALATLRSYAVVGVNPATMGIGPVEAIPVALKRAGITIDDVDLFEVNEAFGSQADYCIEKLGLNRDIVNVMGGAIAIGHPLGMTGARQSVSIIHELRRRKGRFGVVSMCIGTGMGAAAVYEINTDSAKAKI